MSVSTMTSSDGGEASLDAAPLGKVQVADDELWTGGPPHALFRELREKCPVHWSEGIADYPTEAGFWSVTRAEDLQAVSVDWKTFSSARGVLLNTDSLLPAELIGMAFIEMDPPKHDQIKALFQRGFTPKRIAAHEPAIREIVTKALDAVEDRECCDLVEDVAQPVVSRVIGSFVGIPPEDDAIWAQLINSTMGFGDPDLNPDGIQAVMGRLMPEIFARSQRLIAERRERPTDDLTSVLVHAEIDGQRLPDYELLMGLYLLMGGGNDSTKATYANGMKALAEHPDQRAMLVADPSLIPAAIEECLRVFPAFAHQRRTATRDCEIGGQKVRAGEKVVMWYVSSNRDETRYEDPDRFDILRRPEHQAFGAGGRHFCLGVALARLELRVLFEETLARFPDFELAGRPEPVLSTWLNQLRVLPVRLRPGAPAGDPPPVATTRA
jgi:cytochrome P450